MTQSALNKPNPLQAERHHAAVLDNRTPEQRKRDAQGKLAHFQSHKVVQGGLIDVLTRNPDGTATLTIETRGASVRIHVDADYVSKHNPKPGGFYVLYEDGYESWSPARAFQAGYTHHDPDWQPAVNSTPVVIGAVFALAMLVLWLFLSSPAQADGFPADIRVQVDGSVVTLSWVPPSTREDGSALTMAEIDGYEIFCYNGDAPTDNDFQGFTLRINDGNTTSATVDITEAGQWHFAIVTLDTDGNTSELSDVHSINVPEVPNTSPPKAPTGLSASLP